MSVIVTVLDGRDLARAAVESMLTQTLHDLEVIVVDDGSTDGTADVLRGIGDSRVRLITQPTHVGRTRCLNRAVGLARADTVAVMDADDLSFPERLQRQVAALRADPALDLVGARMLRVDPSGRVLDVGPDAATHEDLSPQAWRSIPIPHPTWCGRRQWFDRYPYRRWLRCSEDQEVLYRSFPTSTFRCLDDVLVVKRERPLALPTLLRRRSWFSLGALTGDLARGRWRRAGELTFRTAKAAAGLAVGAGAYEPTWRWRPADAALVARYERLHREMLGRQSA